MDEVILVKIEKSKEIYKELKEERQFYKEFEGRLQKTAYFAMQKKAEELVELAIKINRELLKKKNIIALSYKESFLKLEELGLSLKKSEKYSQFANFRNRLAHEYLIVTQKETIEEVDKIIKEFPNYLKDLFEL